MKIHKYTIPPFVYEHWLPLPADAQILTVQVQSDLIQLYALHSHGNKQRRRVFLVGTNQPMPRSLTPRYIATVELSTGLVWHVFEEMTP